MDLPNFRSYTSPLPHLAFSSSFFNNLTITQAAEYSYPTIAPIGSVSSARFLPEVPFSAAATVIISGEVIPNYNDLKFLTSSIENEYTAGSRSAEVRFRYNGTERCMVYHFSKLELIRNCSNYEPAIISYRHLLMHIQSGPFNLGSAFETFRNSLVTSKIQGFYVSDFQLDKLGCLLGESWLEEDIFNALLEFSYFQNTHYTLSSEQNSSTILLPTSV
ncbi:uncharacterized protein LACBIDRAFT_312302 [Laccaria bicolor S238N-H82]|uniref:Predicted protein n=1 Tax=Laccaria bicolor (strain S238N-H82 / ATCC MYA-4686) TaxID=486041 RepID=B0DVX1_LACBS|nr:uncharacterized protein LACBIDRAFT_312302 [Laccaria bicolor S238N-H82]EDR01207.1 predicted protein [Laccaria bicolor S238N-H82]|eukprot:XP_001888083.1 predicted protein [Laccaria bicolor S238N-H82]